MRSITLNAQSYVDLASEILKKGRSIRLTLKGGSMAPTIVSGEKAVICLVSKESIAVGDIVVVACDRPRVHRVKRVDVGGRFIVTQGDASDNEDFPVSTDLVVGRIIRIEKSLLLRSRRLVGMIKSKVLGLISDGFSG